MCQKSKPKLFKTFYPGNSPSATPWTMRFYFQQSLESHEILYKRLGKNPSLKGGLWNYPQLQSLLPIIIKIWLEGSDRKKNETFHQVFFSNFWQERVWIVTPIYPTQSYMNTKRANIMKVYITNIVIMNFYDQWSPAIILTINLPISAIMIIIFIIWIIVSARISLK